MKRKIFKIICIAVASLLSLAILVGAFMVAIITPKNETISASADTSSATPYFVRQDLYFGYDMLAVGRYSIAGETSTSEVNNYEYLSVHLYELPSSPFTVDIVNVNNYNCEITLLLRFGDIYSVYPLNNGFIEVSSLGSNFSGDGFIRFSNGSFSSNVPFRIIIRLQNLIFLQILKIPILAVLILILKATIFIGFIILALLWSIVLRFLARFSTIK